MNIDRMFERLKEEKELLSEISALRAEVERLKECEAIVNSLGMVSHICLPQANPHIIDIIDTARQWVKDNRHTPGDDGGGNIMKAK